MRTDQHERLNCKALTFSGCAGGGLENRALERTCGGWGHGTQSALRPHRIARLTFKAVRTEQQTRNRPRAAQGKLWASTRIDGGRHA